MDTKPFRTTRRITNLREGRNDWYRIQNSTGPGPAEAFIYDEIGYFGVTAQNFLDDLSAVTGPLTLHLNTPGGDVFDGIAIYSALRQRGDVTVVVDSLAASVGSVIAMGGQTVQMSPGSQLMIHDAFSMGIGNAADLRDLADLLDRQSDNIASIYADRTGTPQAGWRDKMRAETWFTAQEAVSAGLADSIAGQKASTSAPLATFDLSIFAPLAASVDNSPWDGGKAMANGAAADDPAAFYAGICAGKKAGNPRNQDSWALPYKYHPGDAPNSAGVRNALARLPQTEGLTNEAEARETLQRAMKQADPSYNPDDKSDVDVWAQIANTFRLQAGKE